MIGRVMLSGKKELRLLGKRTRPPMVARQADTDVAWAIVDLMRVVIGLIGEFPHQHRILSMTLRTDHSLRAEHGPALRGLWPLGRDGGFNRNVFLGRREGLRRGVLASVNSRHTKTESLLSEKACPRLTKPHNKSQRGQNSRRSSKGAIPSTTVHTSSPVRLEWGGMEKRTLLIPTNRQPPIRRGPL